MRLDEIEEAEVKKAVFTFGRLNPPHFGHHALIQTLQKAAQKQNCDWFLFVSAKTGDEKNPLTYEQKVWWIQTLFPETKGHLIIDPSIKTPLVAATWLYKKGYRAATFVAGEDDMAGYGEMIKSGNAHGEKNPDAVKAGKGFIFEPLDFSISPRLASATNARKNVTDGDPEAFVRSILGPKINPKLAELVQHQLYPTLRKSLGLGESVGESEQLNKRTPNVKELAKKFMTTSDAVHRQLARGVKVEFEHTNDIEVATEIALDHLGEKLDYYTRLAKAENETADPKKKFGENFADGKGPGRPGDSQRHGIPKKATISQLEKASHAKGRKGQLARWQLNMRRGKKRANEELTNEVADQPYRFISPVSTATTQKSMFQTDSGTTIQVFIQVDTGNGVADIGFFDATDKENPTIGVTGKGDAFRVFATVGSIVKQFVAKRKPPYISFSGKSSDAGRIKLYDMIAKNIGRYLPEYKLIDSGFANGDKGYTFKRVAQESWSPMELAIMEGGHLLEEFDSGKIINEDEFIKPRVYLDMDGVLADFFSEWSRLAGVKHYKDINNTEETLQLVREHPTFWIDLPMLPHARALVKTVIEKYGEYRICSTPLAGDERSKPGKIAWIKKHLSDMPPAEIVLTHSKADHALGNGVANILVDDYGVNVNKWRAAGGIGIKYEDSAFDHVAKILGSIAKSGVSK